MKQRFFVIRVLFICFGSLCLSISPKVYSNQCAFLEASNIQAQSTQVISVKTTNGSHAHINACEKINNQWRAVFNVDKPAVIGKNGLAAKGAKKEGDLKTPTGLYPIRWVFGSEPMSLKMDFRYITPEDKFVDDPTSKDYNVWVYGPTTANSFEPMLVDEYRMGAVVDYNMSPAVPGAGSAIFIHLWKSPNIGTHGCIAMDEKTLKQLLLWLDKHNNPLVSIQ